MRRPLLHVLAGTGLPAGTGIEDLVRAAVAGGADVVQLRDKSLSDDEVVETARRLLAITRPAGVRLLVNDRPDLARLAGADGAHVGPGDRPVADARAALPRPALLGASARTVDRARSLAAAGADYLGTGPVYGTATKADAPGAIGLEGLAAVARAVDVPVIGIGGIDATNAAAVVRAGAAGVAVVSAVAGSADPAAAVRALRAALDGAGATGGAVAEGPGRC